MTSQAFSDDLLKARLRRLPWGLLSGRLSKEDLYRPKNIITTTVCGVLLLKLSPGSLGSGGIITVPLPPPPSRAASGQTRATPYSSLGIPPRWTETRPAAASPPGAAPAAAGPRHDTTAVLSLSHRGGGWDDGRATPAMASSLTLLLNIAIANARPSACIPR
jgi:hypothetical protein